jgi:dGTP triphosphohydrolase
MCKNIQTLIKKIEQIENDKIHFINETNNNISFLNNIIIEQNKKINDLMNHITNDIFNNICDIEDNIYEIKEDIYKIELENDPSKTGDIRLMNNLKNNDRQEIKNKIDNIKNNNNIKNKFNEKNKFYNQKLFNISGNTITLIAGTEQELLDEIDKVNIGICYDTVKKTDEIIKKINKRTSNRSIRNMS